MKRGLFRDLSGYYKNQFSKYVSRYNNLRCGYHEKNAKMELYIQEYIQKQHFEYYENLENQEQIEFVLRLKELLFSNRHKKVELFLNGCDFTLIRRLLYSFKTALRNLFLKSKHNGYLIWQYLQLNKSQLHQKLAKNNKVLLDELDAEISIIESQINNCKA